MHSIESDNLQQVYDCFTIKHAENTQEKINIGKISFIYNNIE